MADRNFKQRRDFRREKPEFEQQVVDIARVTRVMAGGKRMRFRACLIIGDKKGKVGYGLAKAADVATAIGKAYKKAEKQMIRVNTVGNTIPHEVRIKLGSSRLLFKPAPEGTGVIAGGAVRMVLEIAGIGNVVAKILGTSNKVNNVKATIEALRSLKKVEEPKESKSASPVDKKQEKSEIKKQENK